VNLCALYFYRFIGKLTAFFAVSGVQLALNMTAAYGLVKQFDDRKGWAEYKTFSSEIFLKLSGHNFKF
jgi:hypothetical protein